MTNTFSQYHQNIFPRIKHAQHEGHNYFFSWEYELTKDLKVKCFLISFKFNKNLNISKVDWLTGRNICRRHCMDLVKIDHFTNIVDEPSFDCQVSIETREENEFVKQRMINGLIRFFWTSGRKCNFAGCEREDLQPSIVNGKF